MSDAPVQDEPAGQEYLKQQGVSQEFLDNADLLGISGIPQM
ncbi:MAG: hypothetical protein U5P10_14425 [Spirochaetia bacterium]|nr:hypothetical protein [Spirochaetia bacterium]